MTGVANGSTPAGYEAAVEVTRLLFVDDDERTLSGYRRMLRPYRSDWEMTFVESAAAALHEIASATFDVVISDVQMPGMDGVELLETIADHHPEVIRIILSGRTGEETTRRATGVAHQYLAKPCSAEQLRDTVQRSAGIRATLSRPDLVRAVAATKTLPSAPTLYHDLTAELRSADPSLGRVSGIVRRDPGMSAKLLQMVNSAFFGLRRRVTDVHQAVTLLGTDTIAALALSVHVFATANIPATLRTHFDAMWNRALTVATTSKELMTHADIDPRVADEAFLGGLLHDCGKLVLITNFADEYRAMLEAGGDWQSEAARFGADHAAIGAHLLSLWGLPDTIVEAVAFHHRPMESPSSTFSPLTAVHAAVALEDRPERAAQPAWDVAYLDAAGQLGSLAAWVEIADDLTYERAYP
jgi:HD-like signal output (HDOD) protein/ActR/RegA family two-component response regulator